MFTGGLFIIRDLREDSSSSNTTYNNITIFPTNLTTTVTLPATITSNITYNVNATQSPDDFTKENEKNMQLASLLVLVGFIPGLVIAFLFCRFVPGWIHDKMDQ